MLKCQQLESEYSRYLSNYIAKIYHIFAMMFPIYKMSLNIHYNIVGIDRTISFCNNVPIYINSLNIYQNIVGIDHTLYFCKNVPHLQN